jgi:hypothetical protein
VVVGMDNEGDAGNIDDRRNVVRDIGNVMDNAGLHRCGKCYFFSFFLSLINYS